MKLEGRVALVTGAGRRIGRAIAEGLGGRGAHVAVHYNSSRDGAEETAAAIRAAGVEARIFEADLGDANAPARLVDEVVAAFGRLDVLVNSASVFLRMPVGRVTTADWDTVMNVNLRAPFFMTQAAVAAMGEAGGVIVNLADHLIYEPGPNFVPHGISKAGIVQMTQSLAPLLAPRVRINAVAPGAVLPPDDSTEASKDRLVRTTPLRRIGSPSDVVGAVLYLIEADYVTGETLVVDGGRRVRLAPTTLSY
jgi:pteridine reductase